MLYYRCPTCGTVLANKQIPFEEGMKKICDKKMTGDEKDKAQIKLLETLEVVRPCCRMRILTYTKWIEILV